MLKKEQRINHRKEYNNIYQDGKKIQGRHMVVFAKENTSATSRVGIVASKRVGNAVIRNRAKRRLRALIREMWPTFKANMDIVINARPSISATSYEELRKDLSITLRKAKLC